MRGGFRYRSFPLTPMACHVPSEASAQEGPVARERGRWWPRLLVGLLLLLVVLVTSQPRWPVPLPATGLSRSPKPSLAPIKVREVEGPTGHQSVAIDEHHLSSSSRTIGFGLLGEWAFTPDAPASPPAAIQNLDGTRVTLAGFMFPLMEGERVKAFCLMASTQTCCYGPRPQFNQYVVVEVPEPVPFERLRPVYVSGILHVEPRPADGYIYRMEGETVTPAPDEEVNGVTVEAGTPVFPLEQLATVRPLQVVELDQITIPASLTAMRGAVVQVHGFVLARFTDQNPPPLLVGCDWWDGCCQGVPPDIFNSLLVRPASDAVFPEHWYKPATFTGVLQFNPIASWLREGIFQITSGRLVKEVVP